MKKLISLSLLLCLSITMYGQNISDYEYIYVPTKFSDFDTNEYNLNTLLKKALQDKKYKVVQQEMTNWPEELRQNPCKVLNVELNNDSNMFRNRVKLQFTDCQKKVISETKGNSLYKEYDLGFQDALKQSLATIPVCMPNPNNILSKVEGDVKTETPKPINQKEIQEVKKETTAVDVSVPVKSQDAKKVESFSKGNVSYQKINISKDQFILVSTVSSVPYATFKSTAKADVYRVTLESGTSTLGYYENGNLVIEIPTNGGDFKREVFIVK